MFRISREKRTGADPLIDVKIVLLVLGLTSGIYGMVSNDRRFIDIAIIIIAIGILLRFVRRRRDDSTQTTE